MISPAEARDRIRYLEEASRSSSALHRLHPLALLGVTLTFLIAVVSTERNALSGLLPLAVYPLCMLIVGGISGRALGFWLLPTLPLLIGLGFLNPLLDPRPLQVLPGMAIASGWLSFLSLLVKGLLTVTATLALIAITGFHRLSPALRRLGLPDILVLQLVLMGRYITLLLEEGHSILSAWQLRAPDQKGLSPTVWGPLMGQWLMRTLDRSHRIYQAMLLRGFDGSFPQPPLGAMASRDWRFLLLWAAYIVLCRAVNLPQAIGRLILGG